MTKVTFPFSLSLSQDGNLRVKALMDSSVSLSINVLILSRNTVFHILSEVNRDLVNSVTAFG